MSISLPSGFSVIGEGTGIADLGAELNATLTNDSVTLVARRSTGINAPIDLVVVHELEGSLTSNVDLCGELQRFNSTPMDARDVTLQVGTAKRCAVSAVVPVPDVEHLLTNRAIHWFFDVDGNTVDLMIA